MSRKTCYSTGNRITTTQLGTIDFSGHDRAKNRGRRGSFCGRRERAFRGGEREGGRRRTGTSVLTQLVALAVASPSLPTPRSRRQGTPCVRACYAACCAQPHKVSRCATPYNAMAESTLCGNPVQRCCRPFFSPQPPPLLLVYHQTARSFRFSRTFHRRGGRGRENRELD